MDLKNTQSDHSKIENSVVIRLDYNHFPSLIAINCEILLCNFISSTVQVKQYLKSTSTSLPVFLVYKLNTVLNDTFKIFTHLTNSSTSIYCLKTACSLLGGSLFCTRRTNNIGLFFSN